MTTTSVSTATANAETLQQFQQVMPDKMKKSMTPELLKTLDNMLNDQDMREAYRDNLIGYTSVMNDGKFKLESYVMAVKYVSYKLMGNTNIDAFSKTFPEKIMRWNQQQVASKDVASYVSAYHKSKLVSLIIEQSLIPSHVLNADVYQKAINIQLELAMNAQSEKVRSDAANSLLTHLKAPEKTKIQVDVNHNVGGDSISALRKHVEELRDLQKTAISGGHMTAQQVAEGRLFDESQAEDAEVISAGS